jgi:hypothetical protein
MMNKHDARKLRCRRPNDCELDHCGCGHNHHEIPGIVGACAVDPAPRLDEDVRASERAAGWDPNP